MTIDLTRRDAIRKLNDDLRTTLKGNVKISDDVQALGPTTLMEVVRAVQTHRFNKFDAYCERDFGSFEVRGHRLLFEIHYYDLKGNYGFSDPSDPEKTIRVLHILERKAHVEPSQWRRAG